MIFFHVKWNSQTFHHQCLHKTFNLNFIVIHYQLISFISFRVTSLASTGTTPHISRLYIGEHLPSWASRIISTDYPWQDLPSFGSWSDYQLSYRTGEGPLQLNHFLPSAFNCFKYTNIDNDLLKWKHHALPLFYIYSFNHMQWCQQTIFFVDINELLSNL